MVRKYVCMLGLASLEGTENQFNIPNKIEFTSGLKSKSPGLEMSATSTIG